ncbi:MAG: DUF4261 domain-containing protein [Eubacterium sp.]|nr:DUF4261 domain-containing protein [Eubacterium sp.]
MSEQEFKQDLTLEEQALAPFMIHLFMKEKCELPDKDTMTEIMLKHLSDVSCFSHDNKLVNFSANKYTAEFKEGSAPPLLTIMECMDCEQWISEKLDAFIRSQMWDCPDKERILSECKYHVIAMDMMAASLPYRDRADMLMDFTEALVEMFPQCEAVYFDNSGKMFSADKVRNHNIPRDDRFIYFAVNVRFFNISGTDDMVIDSLGMSILHMPDLQYHFHGVDPNWVVNHAYNLLSYIYANDNPIKNGETVDGVSDGHIDINLQWRCHYENSLIQPAREVLDICMNEYASGGRNYDE